MCLKLRICLKWKIFLKWQNVWLNCLSWLLPTKTTFSTHFSQKTTTSVSAAQNRSSDSGDRLLICISQIYIKIICCWFWSNWILLHMPLNMKCNITIDYTIAVVPDVNEFNWVLQNQVDVAFLSSSFCKFFDQLCAQEWCFFVKFLLVLKFKI